MRAGNPISRARSKDASLVVLAVLFAASVVAVLLIDPYDGWPAQDPGYHDFADGRTILGVPNFWNVVSNLPFLLTGLLGMAAIYASWGIKHRVKEYFVWLLILQVPSRHIRCDLLLGFLSMQVRCRVLMRYSQRCRCLVAFLSPVLRLVRQAQKTQPTWQRKLWLVVTQICTRL